VTCDSLRESDHVFRTDKLVHGTPLNTSVALFRVHDSILSKNWASGKPGVIQTALTERVARVLGGFNRSSQRLDNEELRWKQANLENPIVLGGLRCRPPGARR
jgi:hypothetical protein